MKTFNDYFAKREYYHNTLNPKFWVDDRLSPKVRESLITIVDDFIDSDSVVNTDIIDDIQITGSIANFNYSEYSDIDVHILLDFKDINTDEELVKRVLDAKRIIWNLNHDIQINGHEVELYFQDIHEQHISSGLYSITQDDWIHKPVHDDPEVDPKDVHKKALTLKKDVDVLQSLLDNAVDDQALDQIKQKAQRLKDKIINMRRSGLKSDGEFSIENLAFKSLRDTDYIEKLNDIITQAYDQMHTINHTSGRLNLETWYNNILKY